MADKRVRDAAVDSLAKWLRSKSSVSQLEAAKLWKALFYCTLYAKIVFVKRL